jgi:hypothetical protein
MRAALTSPSFGSLTMWAARLVVLVLDVADDLLDEVLDGHQPSVPPYSSTTSAMWMCVDCMRISRFAAGMDGGTKITGRRSLIEAIGLDRSTRPRSGDGASARLCGATCSPLAYRPQRRDCT